MGQRKRLKASVNEKGDQGCEGGDMGGYERSFAHGS